MQQHTSEGKRHAWIQRGLFVPVPANTQVYHDLYTVHSKNPLMSQAYQAWAEEISPVGATQHGHQFRRITDPSLLSAARLSYSNIGLFISQYELDNSMFELIQLEPSRAAYRPRFPIARQAQITVDNVLDGSNVDLDQPLYELEQHDLTRVADYDDALEFSTSQVPRPTLLFVSQQFHPRWRASSGGESLKTVVVNGLYQGVVVPPGTGRISLEFAPYTRWMWFPQFLFAGASLWIVYRRLRR
jgi:hypothetical protein